MHLMLQINPAVTDAQLCWTEPATSVIPEEVIVDCFAPVYGGRKGIATPYAKKLEKQHKVELGSVTGLARLREYAGGC
ncbi:Dihydrolipoyllysine-residue acetyltransferase component 4 of pyruvate dehydrogenase complex chloroplastic [Bienertia sinuspersici]